MKLTLILCLLQLTLGNGRLLAHTEVRGGPPGNRAPRSPGSQGAGSMSYGRIRPLFARRGQYERQRIHISKPKGGPAVPGDSSPPVKVEPNPVKATCSQLTQSCLPISGCCDSAAMCHCRFFNTICFCRRAKSQTGKKTRNISTPKLSQG